MMEDLKFWEWRNLFLKIKFHLGVFAEDSEAI
jgi:hypothetical protein